MSGLAASTRVDHGDGMTKHVLALAVAALGLFAVTVSSDAAAATTYSLGGGMGSQSFGSCAYGRIYGDIVSHDSGTMALPSGTYYARMGASTSWQIMRNSTTDNTQYGGYVKLEIIERAVFGAETVRTAYVRSFDSNGQNADSPSNQELGSFVASNSGSVYFARVTTNAWGCAGRAFMINTRAELVAE